MAIVDAVTVSKQALGQVGIGMALDLDVDQQPVFRPIGVDHAHQLVHQAPALLGIAHDVLHLVDALRLSTLPTCRPGACR